MSAMFCFATHLLVRPLRSLAPFAAATAMALAGSGCTTLNPYSDAAFNQPFNPSAKPPENPPRHSFAVDGGRGNPKVLMFLSLSGGGSRSAYLSTATMLALQDMKDSLGADLLAEVDMISSVSGGSIAAAYYAASRDKAISDSATLDRLMPLLTVVPPVQSKLQLSSDAPRRLGCSGALTAEESIQLRTALNVGTSPAGLQAETDWQQLVQLCLAATYPAWDRDSALQAMKTDYLRLWFANWFWPRNIWRYWTSSFDRSDIMAQTLANNLYSRRGLLGDELTMADLNPARPYLVINATNASGQTIDEGQPPDNFPFGSVFTFTQQDFRERLNSEASSYSLARAVMGSSSFPLVFASMTLEDFRRKAQDRCPTPTNADGTPCLPQRFMHIFDGGNSDNLGLRSVKRTLLELEADGKLDTYDRVLVVMVDAFTLPKGAARDRPDPRSLISLLVDTNVSDAVDSLLQTNRAALLREFDVAELGWSQECMELENGLRQLSVGLCDKLRSMTSRRKDRQIANDKGERPQYLNLKDRLVFYHFAFEDVASKHTGLTPQEAGELKRKLDKIPTSFRIGHGDVELIDQTVQLVINPRNPCMQAMARLVKVQGDVDPQQVGAARQACKRTEGGRAVPPG